MTLFRYLAIDAAGHRARGTLTALDERELEQRLRRLGLELVHCAATRRAARIGRSFNRGELITFCFDLEQSLRCGIPLLDAFQAMSEQTAEPATARLVDELAAAVESGHMLSAALAAHPRVFSPVFVALVRAGEQSGRLAEVFANLAASLRWQDEIAAQTRRLLIYPALVLTVLGAVVAFLLTVLVPQIATLLRTLAIDLPPQTRALLAVSAAIRDHGAVALVATSVIAIGASQLVPRSARLLAWRDAALLRVPVIGVILRKIVLARFARFFALLYEAGIAVLDALKTCVDVAHNRTIADALKQAGRHVAAGATLSDAFRVTGVFPPLVLRMLHVGETTGALDTALRNVVYFYGRDVHESAERALKLLEPVLTLALGIVLALVLWCVLSPLYDVLTGLRP